MVLKLVSSVADTLEIWGLDLVTASLYNACKVTEYFEKKVF